MYRRLVWIMLALAIPVVIFNDMFANMLGYPLPDQPWVKWVSPILGIVMFIWGGKPFLSGAVDEIKKRSPGMMLLVALAITVAFLASWAATLGIVSPELNFWWEMALLIVIMLLGHWIEMRSLAQTSSALESLAELLPDEAEKLDENGEIVSVHPDELHTGDIVIVRPGASVPADGRIVDGEASMDESMVTGESRPVRRTSDDDVVAGAVSTDSAVRIEVTATGDDTTLAGIRSVVAEAQNSSSRAQRIADKASGWLFWFVLISAIATAIVWSVLGMPESAVVRAITVLVIACPHALGLAIPLVVSIATERAARGSVLVKDRLALEGMRRVDSVLFYKTGTLTVGAPVVEDVVPAGNFTEDDVIALAASAESHSEHPLASAIVRATESRGLSLRTAEDFSSAAAVGVRARIDDHTVQVGGPYLPEHEGAEELAAGVLAPIGFVLPMSVGAILMSLSTVVVALNAQLLRRLDLSPEASASRFLNAQ